jgi:hypothetical protein
VWTTVGTPSRVFRVWTTVGTQGRVFRVWTTVGTLSGGWGSLPHRGTRHRRVGVRPAWVGVRPAWVGVRPEWVGVRPAWVAVRPRPGIPRGNGQAGSSQNRVVTTRRARRVARR